MRFNITPIVTTFIIAFGPSSALSQNKFFSTSSRGGAEGAKQNAQITAFQNEIQRMNFCTAAGLIYAPTHIAADPDGCTTDASARSLSDDLSVGGHMSVSGTLRVDDRIGVGIAPQLPLDIAGAVRIAGETETCAADKAGSMRYNPVPNQIEFCNGTSWTSMGGGGGSGAFAICDGTDITSANCDPTKVIGIACAYTGQMFSNSTVSYSASWIGPSGGRWVMWDNGTQASSISGMHSCGQVLTYLPGGGSGGGGSGGGGTSLPTPPTCSGPNAALQWDGSGWLCGGGAVAASCASAFLSECHLPSATHGAAAGTCDDLGSCRYVCFNGTWAKSFNNCFE